MPTVSTKVVFRFHQKQNAFAQVEVDPITWSKPQTTLCNFHHLPKKMRYRNRDLDVVYGINYEAPWKNCNHHFIIIALVSENRFFLKHLFLEAKIWNDWHANRFRELELFHLQDYDRRQTRY